jgi:PAS domain S-box-containing protein
VTGLAGSSGATRVADDGVQDDWPWTEAPIRAGRPRLRAMLEGSPVTVLAYDRRPALRWIVNPQPGFCEEDLPRHEAISRPRLVRVLTTGEAIRDEVQVESGGTLRHYDVTLRPFPDGTGAIVGVAVAAFDITERKRVEEALRDSEARFRAMLETLPHIAFVIGPDGAAQYYNRGYLDYAGYAVGRDPASRAALVHPDDRERYAEARMRGLASGTAVTVEVRLRRHDDVYRWHILNQKPLERDGRIVAWLGTAVDIDDIRRANDALEQRVAARTAELEAANRALRAQIAEREQAEAALRQAQKMEAMGQLTGGLAHDFNNLLTVIGGNLDLLKPHIASERGRQYHAAAIRGAERGATLTQSLLAFARRQILRPQSLDPNEAIRDFAPILRQAAGETVTLGLELAPALCCRIDRAQFQAALLNLVVNARDAMPTGGAVTIATSRVTLDGSAGDPGTKPGTYACIAVADAGTGMTQAIAQHVFEPFFTTKEPGKGSGLGLSQVYGFVTQSLGSVDLRTSPGRGTTVRLYLPLAEQ